MSRSKTKAGAAVAEYWASRLKRVDPLAAVLTYDAPPAINRAYDRWERTSLLRNLPVSLKGRSVLDLGCGTGRIALELAAAGAEVTAVDISPAMLQACGRKAHRSGLEGKLRLVESHAGDLTHDLGMFDLITCFGLLEHLRPAERRRCLSAAFARLKSRGRFLAVVNNSACHYLRGPNRGGGSGFKGHFVTTVGLSRLAAEVREHEAVVKVLAANPFYAWLHYGLWQRRARPRTARELTHLARLVTHLDLAFPLAGPLPAHLASHFLVELRRKPRA